MNKSRRVLALAATVALLNLGLVDPAFAAKSCQKPAKAPVLTDYTKPTWKMETFTNGRRPIIKAYDELNFSGGGSTANLNIKDGAHARALGRPIQLDFDATTGVLSKTDFGIKMVFVFQPGAGGAKDTLCYEGTFEDGAGPQPDESGDGHPK